MAEVSEMVSLATCGGRFLAEFTSQVQVHKVRGVAQSYDSAMTAMTLHRL